MSDLIPIGPRWRDLFESYQHTAFRLEVRDAYDPPVERAPLAQFIESGTTDLEWIQSWLASIREATTSGRIFRRVRVVTEPLSDYVRFSLWVAQHNNAAGEDIRYLARQDAAGLPEFDYWLFDSRTAAKMHFGDRDELLGFELIEDPATIVELNYWRDAAWHRAVTRDEFAAKHIDKQ